MITSEYSKQLYTNKFDDLDEMDIWNEMKWMKCSTFLGIQLNNSKMSTHLC